MTRPRAARTPKRHYTGDHNGVGIVLESCLMTLTFEDGTTLNGEVCIVKGTINHGGLPYVQSVVCVEHAGRDAPAFEGG